MDRTNNVDSIKRKVVSGLFITIFVLAFIFACLSKVLPLGRYIVGTFGILTYPMLIALTLISVAKFMGFSYTKSMKATAYFWIFVLSILMFIHAVSTFKALDAVVNGKTFAKYLEMSYTSKVTLLGSCGSIVCGLISMLLGAMGVVVLSVISATLFMGLFIDYQFYGKYEPHVKKIKNRVVREKVHKSDKKKSKTGEPSYSFNSNEDVVGEIVAADDYAQAESNLNGYAPTYDESQIVGEITNEDESTFGAVTNYPTFEEYFGTQTQEEPAQTQNTFDNTAIYQEKTYPGVYDSDDDAARREWLSQTFGGYRQEEPKQEEPVVSFDLGVTEPVESSFNEAPQESTFNFGSDSTFGESSTGLFGNDSQEEDELQSGLDALSKILNSSDDDVASAVKDDVFGSGLGLDIKEPEPIKTTSFGYEPKPVEPKPVEATSNFGSFGNGYSNDSFEKRNAGFNASPRPIEPARPEPQKPEITISSTHGFMNEQPAKVVVPPKPMPSNSFGVNMAMKGVKYNPPPLSLLSQPKPDTGDYSAEQNKKSAILEQVLEAFGVPVKVANIVRGPKITRYELSVPWGVSVDKIPRHENDIARALCAKTVTIKAPIPGSPYVGIELENDTFTSVCLRELLESKEFQNCKDPLPVVIGKDISGEIVVKSLAKMVHLLVAGSTGSGKSVFVHNMILSLLFKYSPDDLRFMLIDPKKVEFNIYNGLPHLLTPEVVLGAEKALNALKWCVKEMDRRYDLMSKAGYNNIEPYNKSEVVKAGQIEKLPYIVIVIDEFAEVMVANKKEAEVCVQRITQLARACGMHLIIATQRPSVDVITGVIKNNIPSRVALSLQSGIDSKTILNTVGAEKLLGQGDMIFAPTGTSAWPRLQGAYATDQEIRAIIDYDIKYNTASFDEAVMTAMDAEQTAPDSVGGNAGSVFVDSAPTKDVPDSYFKIAVKHVMMNGGASVSYLQRRLSIGYSRAARIIDCMEDKGFIAPATGSKTRKVLITPEQFREEFGEEYDSLD